MVHAQVLGHRRIRPTWPRVGQHDGIGPELRRVLRCPQREPLSYGSSRSNDQGVHDQGETPEAVDPRTVHPRTKGYQTERSEG
ncbi:DUF6009 family protein [Streptomyces sp. YGL11-2]|uniref:DUF6009 family protein n=1 Tax=Streptomyces sp. YGL11-2 TaxID=3414028 RepID=UPI003CF60FE1